jgi:UDP:flavonoid glycosyltransferase YjiC (YdhE family)
LRDRRIGAVRKKITLATFGTFGDLHPFLAIALALEERGYRSVIASWPDYAEKVAATGIAFHPVRPALAQIGSDLGLDPSGLVRRAMQDNAFVYRDLTFPYLRAAYEDMLPALEGAALTLTSSLAFGARLAAEKLGIPQLGVVLQPIMFVSIHDPPVIGNVPWLGRLIARLSPAAMRLAFRALKASLARSAKPLHRLRAELGLPPAAVNPLFEGQFSAPGAIGLYSRLLGALQPDYPPGTSITGFAFYDEQDTSIDPELARFLTTGPPPIVFTLGTSAVQHSEDFYDVSLAAARRLGQRAVLVGAPVPRAQFSADLAMTPYTPYSQLFPHAAAVVHHGGIGTVAQALRAGRPQLVVPFLADQPDNAARLERLGVARVLARNRYHADEVAHELQLLLAGSHYAARAADAAGVIAQESGVREVVRLVDSITAREPVGSAA